MQKINILGFANYMVSIAVIYLCHLHVKASIGNKSGSGGILIKLDVQTRQQAIFNLQALVYQPVI